MITPCGKQRVAQVGAGLPGARLKDQAQTTLFLFDNNIKTKRIQFEHDAFLLNRAGPRATNLDHGWAEVGESYPAAGELHRERTPPNCPGWAGRTKPMGSSEAAGWRCWQLLDFETASLAATLV